MSTPQEIIKAHYEKIGREGGSVSSPAKTKAARENGKKGGRPKKRRKTKRKAKA